MADVVTATYVGQGRARVESDGRSHVLAERRHHAEPGAGLCPVELVAAALAG